MFFSGSWRRKIVFSLPGLCEEPSLTSVMMSRIGSLRVLWGRGLRGLLQIETDSLYTGWPLRESLDMTCMVFQERLRDLVCLSFDASAQSDVDDRGANGFGSFSRNKMTVLKRKNRSPWKKVN